MPRTKMEGESRKAGLPPGTLVHIGRQRVEKTVITAIDYSESTLEEVVLNTPEECRKYLTPKTVTWINLTGLHETETIAKLGGIYGIHSLVLEDICHTGHRPKTEDLGKHLFVVAKMIYRAPGNTHVLAEQVSLLLGDNYVLSFQEVEGDVFDTIRNRIRSAKGRIRKSGADYLAYALLDAIVDNYFIVLEDLGERVEDLQEEVVERPEPETLQEIRRLKSDMIFLRKNLWPVRELVAGLEKSESPLIGRDLKPYLRDLYEHAVQVIDTVETLREALAAAMEMYMSSVSNRMNEVMRVLTVIATIFIPLTFIAGVYGMNFQHMPELGSRWGYPAVWGVMVLAALGMLAYFRRRRWL
jgi:magnesium transporter